MQNNRRRKGKKYKERGRKRKKYNEKRGNKRREGGDNHKEV